MLSCFTFRPATTELSFRTYEIKHICHCIIKFHAKYKIKSKWIFITSSLCSRRIGFVCSVQVFLFNYRYCDVCEHSLYRHK